MQKFIAADVIIKLNTVKELSFSAASGLVKVKDRFFSISDDELSLEIFYENSETPSAFYPLLEGTLSEDANERKKQKPDFESLLFVPPSVRLKNGALLAIPSGSKLNRHRAVLVPLDDGGKPSNTRQVISFAPLFAELEKSFLELNVEGAVIAGAHLKLFQRGNGPSSQNAVIDLDGSSFIDEILTTGEASSRSLKRVTTVALPYLNNTPTGFTDAYCASNSDTGVIWFLATGEATTSTYDDGPFTGAFLGQMNFENEVTSVTVLPVADKPEGLWMDEENENIGYIVTDADTRSRKSQFLKMELELKTLGVVDAKKPT